MANKPLQSIKFPGLPDTYTVPQVDNTLTQTGAAADAKKTGDEISDLKSDLTSNNILHYDYVEYGEWVVGSYINSNVSVGETVNVEPITNSSYNHKIISVSQGDLFIVQGQGGNNARLWAFTDTEYKLISKASYTSGQHTEYLTTPADGYLIANTYISTSVVRSVQKYIATSPVYDSVTNKTDKGYYSLNNVVKDNNRGFIEIPSVGETVDYTAISNSDAVYGMFDCAEGDVFKISGSGGILYRLWAFVDANDVVLSKSTANLSAVDLVLTVPANAVKFIYGGNFRNYNVEKLATNSKEIYLQAIYEAEYSQRNNGLDVLSAFNNVSCFGDSLTASVVYTGELEGGHYTTRSAYKKYPQILGDKIGAEYESVATGGCNASDWWSSFADRIIEKTNQLVVVYLGTNGGLTETVDTDAVGDDYSSYADTNTGNYCKIVKKALDVGARVLLVKIHHGGGTGGAQVTNRAIDDVAERFNVAVVDVPFLDDLKYHSYPDGTGYNDLHYNDLGYSAFADSLIKNVGFLPTSMMTRLIPI